VRRGESKLNTVRDGWRHVRYLLLAAPDFLFTLPGAVLAVAGVGATVVSFVAPTGVEAGTLIWQPVFAATILLAVGVNALLFGVVAKLYGVAHGLLPEDRWARLYRRLFRLEAVLGVAAIMFLTGVVIDLALLIIWASGGKAAAGLQLGALAQTLLIVGAELGWTGFLKVTVEGS
jgi:hypothetical protein